MTDYATDGTHTHDASGRPITIESGRTYQHCQHCFCCGPVGYRKPDECVDCLKASLDSEREARRQALRERQDVLDENARIAQAARQVIVAVQELTEALA